MPFTQLGLSAGILRAIAEQGYDTPTPIQREAIPFVLQGRDLEALAQTGTGKTAAFVLPILQRLSEGQSGRRSERTAAPPRCLVLVPTRELAAQVNDSVRAYGKHLPLASLAVFGGVGINPQIAALRRGVDILVATPGRLMDHMQQGSVDLHAIETLVLDEADRMLDMGFIRDIRKILAQLPAKRQNLMFSATFSSEIRELARGLLNNPATVEVVRRNTPAETVDQRVIHVDKARKRDALLHLFDTHGWHQVLVFTRTKHGADALSRKMEQAGITSAALHGNKSQGARQRALADFKSGRLAALVATDIAARGIDIDALPRVVNFELPNVPEDYVHRIGRTGRAGLGGEAISLVCADERDYLRDIQRLIRRDLEVLPLPGFEAVEVVSTAPAAPARRDSGPRRGNGQSQGQGQNRSRDGQPRQNSAPRDGQPRQEKRRESGQAGERPQRDGRDVRGQGNGNSAGTSGRTGRPGGSRSGPAAASPSGGTGKAPHRNGTRHH